MPSWTPVRKPPTITDPTSQTDESPMQLLIDQMHSNTTICTWTSIELYDTYVGYGGQLTRKQMFTKLVTHLGDDVVVLSCLSIVEFREYVHYVTL